jgi:hypothetical protein
VTGSPVAGWRGGGRGTGRSGRILYHEVGISSSSRIIFVFSIFLLSAYSLGTVDNLMITSLPKGSIIKTREKIKPLTDFVAKMIYPCL